MADKKKEKEGMKPLTAFLLGGATFVGASYVMHCGLGMGPWPCQRDEPKKEAP